MKSRLALGVGNRRGEHGQTTIFVVLALFLFLIGFTGLAVDYTNLWFHRQTAQAAADAACQAGATDMLALAGGSPITTVFNPNFTPPSVPTNPATPTDPTIDCASNPNATPCWYAARNGYNGAGLGMGASNSVSFSFPPSIPGVPTTTLVAAPFMRVDVVDRVRVYLSAMITGSRTQDVRAVAKCGLVQEDSPIPIIVLHPSMPSSLSVQGNPLIKIIGGPGQSIQVNSQGVGGYAVNIAGSATVDLTKGGNGFSGSYLGTFGGPATAPGGFSPIANWIAPSPIISDPFANTAQPSIPPATGTKKTVGFNENGCPDTDGCDEYSAGKYLSGICVGNSCGGKNTAIFDPGLYYVVGGLKLAANSTVRPSLLSTDDGSGGTTFFFAGNQTVSVDANSGKVVYDPTAIAKGKNTILQFDSSRVKCPLGSAPDLRLHLPPSFDGNILMAPCSTTGVYYDAAGKSRGMLFFQDRTIQADPVNANWGGGGQFLLAGTMYFHQCNSSGTGVGCADPSSNKKVNTGGFATTFTLQGNSGSGTYVLGEIIADILQLGGTSGINMALDPNASFPILKVSLFQ